MMYVVRAARKGERKAEMIGVSGGRAALLDKKSTEALSGRPSLPSQVTPYYRRRV